MCGQVPPEAIKDLVTACKSGMYSRVQQQVRGQHRRMQLVDMSTYSGTWLPLANSCIALHAAFVLAAMHAALLALVWWFVLYLSLFADCT